MVAILCFSSQQAMLHFVRQRIMQANLMALGQGGGTIGVENS